MKTKIIFSIITSALVIAGTTVKAQSTITGNALTGTPAPSNPTQYLGSSNNYDVLFKAFGTERIRLFSSTGNVNIAKAGVNTNSFGRLVINAAETQNLVADNLVGLSIEKQLNSNGYARRIFFVPHISGGFSWMSVAGDCGMFWTDGGNGVTGSGNQNATSGFVIAPQYGSFGGIRITSQGNVGIGIPLTNNPNNYKLAVNGTIGAKAIKIEISSATWSDYVFNKEYKLRTLPELEAFVKANNHLPNVPSALEVEKDGIDIATMDAKLLEKIEELSLYIIEQNKQITEQNKQVEEQSKRIEKLEQKIIQKH
jgi:hypothetical protein